jgi:hypothetical protein
MTGWRGRALAGGIALVYGGLLLSGMALPFAVAAPVGLAALLAYTILMRPVAQWGGAPARLGLTLVVLGAMASLLALAGGGLALLTGAPPGWLGPAAAVAGIALSRVAWSARKAAELDSFLDEAIAGIEGASSLAAADPAAMGGGRRTFDSLDADEARAVQDVVDECLALPTDADGALLDGILDRVEAAGLADVAAIELDRSAGPAAARARAALALRPEIAKLAFGSFETGDAMVAALDCGDAGVAGDIARRARAAIEEEPDLWRLLPDPAVLAVAGDRLGEPARSALQSLSARIEALSGEDDGA